MASANAVSTASIFGFSPRQECLTRRGAHRQGPDARRKLIVRNMAKDIAFDQSSRASLQAGVEKLANAVGVTLGPRDARANYSRYAERRKTAEKRTLPAKDMKPISVQQKGPRRRR